MITEVFIVMAIIVVMILFLAVVFHAWKTDDPEAPYEGLVGSSGWLSKRQGYVVYSDGRRSQDMPVGNARQYAEIFGGSVFYADGRPA